MVFLRNISTLYEQCFCCKSKAEKNSSDTAKNANQSENQTNKTTETSQDSIWTTDVVNYDATATITASEVMSPFRTGIINHNFQPPGTKRNINLPDVTADTSKFYVDTMTTQCPQDPSSDGEQFYQSGKTTQDAWYFSGSFTQELQKSNEVTEL